MHLLGGILKLMRPAQWVKNAFVLLPLFFHGTFDDVPLLLQAVYAMVVFSMCASAVYCINDINDCEEDRLHPRKCTRPIASGLVPKRVAGLVAIGLLGGALAVTLLLIARDAWLPLGLVMSGYVVMNLVYSMFLRTKPVVDIFVVALGFVLRIGAGGIVTHVDLSHWIVVMTFLLALFLAMAKRRSELSGDHTPRPSASRYTFAFVDTCLGVFASITMLCYILYTLSDEVVERVGSSYFYVTSVFVLAGIVRYLFLVLSLNEGGSPTRLLYRDHTLWACIGGWILTCFFFIYR